MKYTSCITYIFLINQQTNKIIYLEGRVILKLLLLSSKN